MHQKHPPLARPRRDHYARTDCSLVGSTCAVMDPILQRWATEVFASTHRTLVVYGDHSAAVQGARTQVQDKVFDSRPGGDAAFNERIRAGHYDLALVNGNHYPAARQIVLVDPAKAGTLERRRAQLTDVLAVVLMPGVASVPDWLVEWFVETGQSPPTVAYSDLDAVVLPLLESVLGTRARALNALILAGGKSTRMGTAKSELVYRPDGRSEVRRLADTCRELIGDRVYVSVGPGGAGPAGYPTLPDRFVGMGPAGAICTALQHDPDGAWLVVACDLPLLEAADLQTLLDRRQPAAYATAYRLPGERFPEPLVTIYEPKAFPRLLEFLSLGYACPRKMLINSDTAIVEAASARPFRNANTPEDRAEVMALLAGKATAK